MLVALVAAASASPAAPPKLSISGGSSTIQAGQSSALYTVALSGATGPATVALSSTSSTGTFSPGQSINIPANGSSATFSYSDTTAGSPTITAKASGSFKGNPNASKQVTVTAGPAVQIAVSPTSSTIDTNGQQPYAVTGKDQWGNNTGDVTGGTSFSISSGGSCSANTCSAASPGAYTVTATYPGGL
ncbi:MAG TPA: hypothetical protein VGP69_17050, partial [Gaiellaceae bacterium]|nr:hypothetical protein [Gaiellaceae bacterium]